MLASLGLQSSQIFALWVWSLILPSWTFISIMSLVFALVANHILDISSWEDIDFALTFLLFILLLLLPGATICEVSSLSAYVAKHHRCIPALLAFLSFHWCDVGHHSFILLSMILNHIGWRSRFLVGTISG